MASVDALKSLLAPLRRRIAQAPLRRLEHELSREIAATLVAEGDDPYVLIELLLDLERHGSEPDRRKTLIHLLHNHPAPHRVNHLLARDEMARGSAELASYPVNVWLDLSNVCTVQCRFCKYVHKHHAPEHLSLEHVQSIEWLKYTSLLNLSAGTAESIANPRFIEIFQWLRDTYPHLHITLLSNGKTLNEKIVRALAGNLDQLHVSMNAGNREDYDRMIEDGSWERFAGNMKTMRDIFRDHGRPRVTASFVMMRWNLDRAEQYLEFARNHGADQVLFHHYYVPYIRDLHDGNPGVLGRKMPQDESLYFDRDRSDEVFARVRRRADEMGIDVVVPVPFQKKDTPIYFGVRSQDGGPADCSYPWTNLYLLWGFKSRREEVTICCGLASDLGVFFERDEVKDLGGLKKIWNHPTLQAYRRTVNGSRINPICRKCREIDRFDPNAEYPHQAEFFEFNDLPIPRHHSRTSKSSDIA